MVSKGVSISGFEPLIVSRGRLSIVVSMLLAIVALFQYAIPGRLNGQTTASLSGTVQDASGAVIPGAAVTLINISSKATRSTTSNGEGFFNITAIQPATYDVRIVARGFDALKITGIEIHPGDNQTIQKLAMKIGKVDTQVIVSSSAAGVNLSSPEKSSLITAEDIARLSTVGRDVSELVKFLPGFAISTGGGLANGSTNNNSQQMGFGSTATSSFSANGSTPQTGATTVMSDGASVMDPGDMGASITNVNMDMVQEVKVQTSNFGADSAKGPVVINAVGKSGGSDYHGSAYFYARNGALNSNEWLNNYNGVTRPDSKYYFPGGNIGGPVRIPGTDFNHNKKLTFWSGFEYYKQQNVNTLALSFIPTARMLTGDLSPESIDAALGVKAGTTAANCTQFYSFGQLQNSGGYCYSPPVDHSARSTSRDQTGAFLASPGVIPQSSIDPRALIYAKFWPKINRTPRPAAGQVSDGYNYADDILATHNGFQYHARVDENFTDNTKLYVTYNWEKINDENPVNNQYYAGADIIPYPTSDFSNAKAHSATINFTHVFSPSLTNEVVIAGTYFYAPSALANNKLVSDASTGWSGGRFYNNGLTQLPNIIDYEQGVPDFAMSSFPNGLNFLRKFSYSFADNLSKQFRTHSLKFGVYYEQTGNNQIGFSPAQGQNAFNHYGYGCYTNDGSGNISQLHNNVLNFLEGCSQFSQASSAPPIDLHFKTLDFYATDEWKATKRLTLTFGIRADHLGPWTDVNGVGLAVWNAPTPGTLYAGVTGDPRTYPGISWHQTNKSIPLSGAPDRLAFYSPRAGVAFDLYGDGRTVFRGGWGAYRFHDSYNDSAGPLATSTGVQTYSTPSNVNCTYDQIANASNSDTGSQPGIGCPQQGQATASPFAVTALDPHDDQQPVTYNYNLTLDQRGPWSSNFEISYVGNQSANIFTEGNLNNVNYIRQGALFQPDPITGQLSQPGNSQQVVSHFRPFPNYTTVSVPSHVAYGNYNGLQASWNRQKGAFIYGVNYTWEKALGIRGDYRTGSIGDPSKLRNNYGYLLFNRNHILNFTYSYQVGNAYHGNRLISALLNQWELSGITGIQSGPDVAVITSTNFGLSGGLTYTVPGATQATMLNLSNQTVLGTPDINLQPVVTCNPTANLHADNSLNGKGRQYINGNCFALPANGQNGQFELPDIHGPSYFNSDLTVARAFKVREKQSLQLRMSGFNFLNHPLPQFYGGNRIGLNLGYGNTNAATTPQEAIAAATQTTSNFGYTPYKGGYRIVELALKYTF